MIKMSDFHEITNNSKRKEKIILTVGYPLTNLSIDIVRILDFPKYVKFLGNRDSKEVCLFAAEEGQENTYKFAKNRSIKYMHIHSMALHRFFNELSGLDDSYCPYRIVGKVDHFENGQVCIIFDFKNSTLKK